MEANAITKEELINKNLVNGKPLSRNTIRQTLLSCGLDPGQKLFSGDEEQKFSLARTMIESGKTYQQVAEHFKVNLKNAGTENAEGAFTENQATEASGGVVDSSVEVASAIGQGIAQQTFKLIPGFVAYHLNQMMGDGSLHQEMQRVTEIMQKSLSGNSHALLMQGIQRLEAQPIAPSKTQKQLASTSGNGKGSKPMPSFATSTVSSEDNCGEKSKS